MKQVPGFLAVCDDNGVLYESIGNKPLKPIEKFLGTPRAGQKPYVQCRVPCAAEVPTTPRERELIEKYGREAYEAILGVTEKKAKTKYVRRTYARLVCAAHHGPEPHVPFVGPNEKVKWVPVRHRDKNTQNMHPDNLYWDTDYVQPEAVLARMLSYFTTLPDDAPNKAKLASSIDELRSRILDYRIREKNQ